MHILLSAILAMPMQAPPQGPDWDLTRDPARSAVAASTQFDNGLAIAVRCLNGDLSSAIYGLPAAAGEEPRRPLRLAFGDDPPLEQTWLVGSTRTTAVSPDPLPLARSLRRGGAFQVSARNAENRSVRYVIELPASSAAIEAVLSACA